jgi:phage terminase small subunit
MPRRSSASLSVVSNPAPIQRLLPPPDLDEFEKAEFINLVLAVRPDHFTQSDLPLLASYAKAICLERRASGELRAAKFVLPDGRPSPWLAIMKEALRTMTTMARTLRLTPASRVGLVPQRQDNVSYYERMALEGQRDPEPN